MPSEKLDLVAHLMRRAGFGATGAELDELVTRSYEDLVDDLVNPERFPEVEEDVLRRYYPDLTNQDAYTTWAAKWVFRMVNTQRPLEEKMTLFWHYLFATGWGKSEHGPSNIRQIETFRKVCMSEFATILRALSRDPGMIDWLDNNENHRTEPNENYGRELLELFSMGVGNYTEHDVKMAARAFTGWTFTQPVPLYPYGHYPAEFTYREDDHDYDEKTFLGVFGRFNGDDIVEIIVKQPAAARFVCRHLYNFYVADEPQVSAWNETPPRDPAAVEALMSRFLESDGDIRSVLRVLFNSDFFKRARFRKVKSPAELVAGTIKMTGSYRFAEQGLGQLNTATTMMGQQLMNPPTVEGWHTGKEWINGGTLSRRVNFAVDEVADIAKPGIQDVIGRLRGDGHPLSPEEFVDRCLELLGPIRADPETRQALVKQASVDGELDFRGSERQVEASERVGRMLQYIVASKDFQLA